MLTCMGTISEIINYNSFFLFDDLFNGCRKLHKRSVLRVEKYLLMIAFKTRINISAKKFKFTRCCIQFARSFKLYY
jgi:hypothetical protein